MCTLDEVRKAIAGKDDKELVKSLVELNKCERTTSADILLHLIEVEPRKLHLEYGYSSLFSYACKELHYSEPAAHRPSSQSPTWPQELIKKHDEKTTRENSLLDDKR